jgi:hypothetical protein
LAIVRQSRSWFELLCPPVLWGGVRNVRRGLKRTATDLRRNFNGKSEMDDGTKQVLGVYWDAKMANLLNTWAPGARAPYGTKYSSCFRPRAEKYWISRAAHVRP